jgi:hypothetical protein
MKSEARRWFMGAAAAAVALLGGAAVASADGEAGLVIQEGGEVTTYCIAYTGGGITGEELLKRAGLTVEQFGGGGGRAVCAIGGTGCPDASSFSSCFCECKGGGSCVYWAFFTREYGKGWVYSSLAFNLLKADDGDVHGWKWGAGGPSSAPAPVDVTFEQVCGHAPRGGTQPARAASPTPPGVQPASPAATATAAPTTVAQPTDTATPPVGGAPSAAPPDATVTVVVTVGQTPTPATADDTGGEEPESIWSRETVIAVVGFAVIAVLMLGAILGAAIRGRGDRDDG